MISLFKQVIFRFQSLIFQGVGSASYDTPGPTGCEVSLLKIRWVDFQTPTSLSKWPGGEKGCSSINTVVVSLLSSVFLRCLVAWFQPN